MEDPATITAIVVALGGLVGLLFGFRRGAKAQNARVNSLEAGEAAHHARATEAEAKAVEDAQGAAEAAHDAVAEAVDHDDPNDRSEAVADLLNRR